MKRIIFAAFAALMLLNAAAAGAQTERLRPVQQRPYLTENIGISFGYVNSSYRTTDWATDEVERTPALNGFAVSLTKDIALIRSVLYFRTGLGYTYQTRSRVLRPDILPAKVISDRKEHFLSVPLRLRYSFPVFSRIAVTADAGPVLLAGLSSKMIFRTKIQEDMSSTLQYNLYNEKYKASSGSAALESWAKASGGLPYGRIRRFDVLIGAGVGADFFDILEVRLGYDWGLVNKYKGDVAADKKMYRGQFTLSAGIRF